MTLRAVAGGEGEPSGLSRPFDRVRRWLLLVSLAVFVAWRVIDSTVVLGARTTEIGLRDRVEIARLDVADRMRRTLGQHAELFEALRSVLPRSATVVISTRRADLARRDEADLVLLADRLGVLLFPARVFFAKGPVAHVHDLPGAAPVDTWVVDVSPELPLPPEAPLQLVREGPGFRVWHWVGTDH